jgi:hypothetical protein
MFSNLARAVAMTAMTLLFLDGAGTSLLARSYYLSSRGGDDAGAGSAEHPWRSLQRLGRASFLPGDNILVERGSEFAGGFELDQSGNESAPITISSYGSGGLPVFTNPDGSVLSGNAIRVNASHVVVQQLFFKQCPAQAEAIDVRNLGAVFLTTNADQVIVRGCEMTDTPVGVTVCGQHDLIISNYIHDATKPLKPYWGPMGVVVCSSHNEISYNRIINYCAPSREYGHDGGAIEINDRGLAKEDILIHHNLSLRNQGFIEWVGRKPAVDPRQKAGSPAYTGADGGLGPVIQDGFVIHHNVCMDYQSFLGLTGPCTNVRVENNTVVRTLAHSPPDSEDVTFWEYFENKNISLVNNIFVWDGKCVEPVFSRGRPYHDYNLFYRIDGAKVAAGPNASAYQRRYLGGGAELNLGEKIGDPLFRDLKGEDFRLKPASPAIGAGTSVSYATDFAGQPIPTERAPSVGAYEFAGGSAADRTGRR